MLELFMGRFVSFAIAFSFLFIKSASAVDGCYFSEGSLYNGNVTNSSGIFGYNKTFSSASAIVVVCPSQSASILLAENIE